MHIDYCYYYRLTKVFNVAGQYGSGKRGGGVSTLICAVLDDRQLDTEDEEPKFVH